jgi:predicted nuclease of predicted toxin-antitoxin system
VNFLIDSSLSPLIADRLRWAGHDSVQVRRYGIHKSEDEVIFNRAAEEARVLVSADTTFTALLAARQAVKPSVILFRRAAPKRRRPC